MTDRNMGEREIKAMASSPGGRINWLPLLICPASICVAVLFSRLNSDVFLYLKATLEAPAPFMAGLVALVYATRSLVTMNPLYILLTALAATFTCREIHWDWTSHGVYVMLAGIGVWAAVWHKRLREPLRDWRHTSWLIAAFAAYFISQVIARRAFKFIPGEKAIHIPLEEWVETTAHLLFLATSLVGSWRRVLTQPARPKEQRGDPAREASC